MKNLAIILFLMIFALTAFGQTPKTTPKKTPKPTKTVVPKRGTEAEEFEKAKVIKDATERIAAFQNFIKNFPASAEVPKAQGLIVSAHAEIADKKLEAGDPKGGFELFKTALQETPTPIPDELFTKVILGFPISLYSRNQRTDAFDMVKLIEEKVGANASQLLDLSKFFINVQYGTEAIRLAKKSTELAPDSVSGFQTLAIAYRLNFQIEDAATAYAKALELSGGESAPNKHSLAEMKRALGKTDEAIALYRELLAKNPSDVSAQTGLTLALFAADKVKEAETELAKALETTPNNPILLVGAAYWYAAHNDGAKAVEYSQKAIAADPSNVWAYIAQARGLLAQKKPLEAEKILLMARQYGDFPTLAYEIASARLAAGLYREAAEILKPNFTVNKEGLIETYIGNRILADAPTFTELLSLERRVVLFETKAADTPENTNQLKSLLLFSQKLEAADATEAELAQIADEFSKGDDNMRLHRQLFAASRLLNKKVALTKVLELMQSAIGSVDAALSVPSPSSAVTADEIYESRQYYIQQNLVVVVAEIPRPTLSAILRGRIEDIAGQAYFQQNNLSQSYVRLKRALSVLPENSAWSRASFWHLGEVLQAEGKEKEAIEAYIKSYNKEFPDPKKREFIESLYVKVNGNTDGLDERIGAKPVTTVATTDTKPETPNTDNVKTPEPTPSPEPKTETTPEPKVEETPQPTPETKTDETKTEITALPENIPTIAPAKTPEVAPSPTTTEKTEEVKTETKTDETPKTEMSPNPTPSPETKTEEITSPETKVEPTPETSPSPKVDELKIADKTNEPQTSNTPKPLFEPVIISVGKTETPKTENNETKPTEEKPSESVQKTEIELTEKSPDENKPTENKPSDDKILSGENRPRIIITENTGTKTLREEFTSCKIVAKPDNLSLLNGGGSLGIEVSYENDGGDLKQLSATSSSPNDIELTLDPEIGKGSKKLFFIIKSISTNTGIFTVTFEAPCGKKEILVKVR